MKIVTIICNIVLLGFTWLVTLTDGPPTEAGYIVLGLLLKLIPILNVVVISWSGTRGPMKIAAIVCNVVLLGFACWAIIDQYPHPAEAGVIEFELLVILTPILSSLVIFFTGGKNGWLGVLRRSPAD